MKSSANVGLVGLGTMGSMAWWRFAERGVRVHGYERFGVGHHRSAAGGQTRRFSTLSQRNQRNTPLALDALELWREVHRRQEHQVPTRTGGLILGPRRVMADRPNEADRARQQARPVLAGTGHGGLTFGHEQERCGRG